MTVYYFETSALVKRYLEEQGSKQVNRLFESRTDQDAFASSRFTTLEVEATVARLHRANLLSEQLYGSILSAYLSDLEGFFLVLPISGSLLSSSVEAVKNYALRAGDAIHLATVLRIRDSLNEDVTLVTSDQELVQAGAEAGLTVIDPTEESEETL